MIKAIFFDMGGVLVSLRVQDCIDAFKNLIGFERIEEFLDPCHQKGMIGDMEAGKITPGEFCNEVRRYCRTDVTDDRIAECFCELLGTVGKEKINYLKRLSLRYPLFLLSNANPITMARVRKIFEGDGAKMDELFDDQFVSCEMKMLKPCADIFHESARRSGFREEEILFIDDSLANVEGARAAGLKAVHYNLENNLEETIENELKKYK